MTVRLRPVLKSLPAYVPGRNLPGAIKLASNEITYPPLPYVLERIMATASTANRYPDNSCAELTAALASKFEVPPEHIAIGCGSVSLCQQLVLATAAEGDEVIFGWRSFEAYPIITAMSGAVPVMIPLKDQTFDLPAMAAAITSRTRLIFVCNPNNPTGTAVRGDALVEFLDGVPAEILVVLDEAYREFVTAKSVVDGTTLLARYPNLIVLRTFSKAYGLAGLRVGYGIAADPAVATAVRQTGLPFSVNQVAQAAAAASLEPEAEQQLIQRVAEVTAERTRVTAELRSVGYSLPDSEANFVWLADVDPIAFGTGCEQRGVIVRVFAGSGVRVTIGAPAENDTFLKAARDLRA
jgi:histidinol-phosphate aminotransferase